MALVVPCMQMQTHILRVERPDCSGYRSVLVGTHVRTSWQQELWGTVVDSEVGGRATTGVYIDRRGSSSRRLRESTESRYDLWKLVESQS